MEAACSFCLESSGKGREEFLEGQVASRLSPHARESCRKKGAGRASSAGERDVIKTKILIRKITKVGIVGG